MCVKFREDCSNKRFFFPILCENVKIAKYQTLPENICKSCSHPIIISKLVCCLIFNDFAATFASFIFQNLLFLENWQYKKMFSCDLMRFLLTSPHTFFFRWLIFQKPHRTSWGRWFPRASSSSRAFCWCRKRKHVRVSTTILFPSPTWTAAFTSALLQLYLTLASPPGPGVHMVSKWSTLADLSFSPDSNRWGRHSPTAGSLRRFLLMIQRLESSFFCPDWSVFCQYFIYLSESK